MTDKNRVHTIEAKFGFSDKDSTTPKHDAIMLWLDSEVETVMKKKFENEIPNQDQIKKIIEATKLEECFKLTEKINKEQDNLNKFNIELANNKSNISEHFTKMRIIDIESTLLELKEKQVVRKKQWEEFEKKSLPSFCMEITKIWEQPIKSRDYIIGFIDLFVTVTIPKNISVHTDEEQFYLTYDNIEIFEFYYEVKTSIPSIGEVIRQIQMYKTYVHSHKSFFIIVSPDDRFKDVLNSQDIKFKKVPDEIMNSII